jgi:DNA repair exonuclease SbcCD ATPase subunit
MDPIQSRIDAVERQLAELEARLAELEHLSDTRKDQAGEAARRELPALRERLREKKAEFERLRVQDAQSWEQENLLTGIEAVFDEIGKRIMRLLGR